jgi:hypothetical protein
MEDGVKVAQGVNKNAVEAMLPKMIESMANKDLVNLALTAIKRLE